MPLTPKYHRQQRLPGRLGAGFASPQIFRSAERSLEDLGKVVEYRGLQIQERHDRSKITSGYNTYRDTARIKLSELLQLKGEDATALGEKYDEWYNDFISDYQEKRLGNNRQRRGWSELVATRRGHDLDILARHEAQEMAAFQQQAEAGLLTTTVDDIASNQWDDRAFNTSVNIFMEEMAGLHPGEDVTALKDKYEKAIYSSRLRAQINDNPKRAAAYLEEYKDIIGPVNYKRFKAELDTGVSAQSVEEAYLQLEQMFGNDPQAKLKYIRQSKNYKKLGLDLAEREKLKAIYNGEYNTDQTLKAEQEKQRDRDDWLSFLDTVYEDNNIANGARIARTTLNPGLRAKMEALVQGAYFKSDPEMYNELAELINTMPENVDESVIWSYAPSALGESGINGRDLQSFQQRWEALMRIAAESPTKHEHYKRLQGEIKKLIFAGETVAEQITNRARAAGALQQWYLQEGHTKTMKEINDQFMVVIDGAKGETLTEWLKDIFLKGDVYPSEDAEQTLRSKAIEKLTEKGQATTENNIEEAMRQLR